MLTNRDAETISIGQTASRRLLHSLVCKLQRLLPSSFIDNRKQVARQLRVVETLALAGKTQLLLVRCGREQFLVGASLDGVRAIVRVSGETDTAEVCTLSRPSGVSL